MAKYQEKIVDTITGEVTLRDFTEEEIAEFKATQAQADAFQVEVTAKELARLAILEKLGLTTDEAKLLLG